jgi:putative hemolysin
MNTIFFELGVIVALLLVNGLLAMTEIAVVTARKTRLRERAEAGDARARAALELAENPTRFLATIQVGITLVGVLAAAFGGATLAERLAAVLGEVPGLQAAASPLSLGLVVVGITGLSLVVGELVPKRLGLAHPEGIAAALAGPMQALARLARPLVAVLSACTEAVLRLLPVKPAPAVAISDEEVRLLVREGTRAGVFHPNEPAMVEGVLALDRLPVRQLMTPRAKIIWVNVDDPHEAIWHKIVVSGHTTFPVYEGNRDRVVGVVTVKAIYANLAAGIPPRVRDLMTPALIVPATLSAAALLDTFKRSGKHLALVADEFGGIVGLISLHDILEAIIGELPSPDERLKPTAQRREDGSWLVDAAIELDDFARLVPDFELPPPAERDYRTFAGFVFQQLGRVPAEGESFPWRGYVVEVIDMDGHRVDKVLLLRPPANPPPRPPAAEPPA